MILKQGGRARLNSHFGKGNRPILLSHLYCFGHEPNLLECDQRACGTTLCSHINDAGVVCECKLKVTFSQMSSGFIFSKLYQW